jgi:hypothetical protein
LTNPDQVASCEYASWATAFWYWKANVGNVAAVQSGQFGASTRAINGALECNPGGTNQAAAKNRYNIYTKVLVQLGDNETPIETGCYN